MEKDKNPSKRLKQNLPKKHKYNLDQMDVALRLLEMLRQEMVSSQKIRAQIIGFKVTAVTATVGIVLSLKQTPDDFFSIGSDILIVIAIAAVFFDFLVSGHTWSIKRAGYYIREHLERKVIGAGYDWGNNFQLWEGFISKHKKTRQKLSFWGNIGLTMLVSILSIAMAIKEYHLFQFSTSLDGDQIRIIIMGLVLVFLVVADLRAYFQLAEFNKEDNEALHAQMGDISHESS